MGKHNLEIHGSNEVVFSSIYNSVGRIDFRWYWFGNRKHIYLTLIQSLQEG